MLILRMRISTLWRAVCEDTLSLYSVWRMLPILRHSSLALRMTFQECGGVGYSGGCEWSWMASSPVMQEGSWL